MTFLFLYCVKEMGFYRIWLQYISTINYKWILKQMKVDSFQYYCFCVSQMAGIWGLCSCPSVTHYWMQWLGVLYLSWGFIPDVLQCQNTSLQSLQAEDPLRAQTIPQFLLIFNYMPQKLIELNRSLLLLTYEPLTRWWEAL